MAGISVLGSREFGHGSPFIRLDCDVFTGRRDAVGRCQQPDISIRHRIHRVAKKANQATTAAISERARKLRAPPPQTPALLMSVSHPNLAVRGDDGEPPEADSGISPWRRRSWTLRTRKALPKSGKVILVSQSRARSLRRPAITGSPAASDQTELLHQRYQPTMQPTSAMAGLARVSSWVLPLSYLGLADCDQVPETLCFPAWTIR
jgi:hypothetical protein